MLNCTVMYVHDVCFKYDTVESLVNVVAFVSGPSCMLPKLQEVFKGKNNGVHGLTVKLIIVYTCVYFFNPYSLGHSTGTE